MLTWVMDNIGTIIVALVLIGVVGSVIAVMIKNKKNGKSSCGCGCSHCTMSSYCHKER